MSLEKIAKLLKQSEERRAELLQKEAEKQDAIQKTAEFYYLQGRMMALGIMDELNKLAAEEPGPAVEAVDPVPSDNAAQGSITQFAMEAINADDAKEDLIEEGPGAMADSSKGALETEEPEEGPDPLLNAPKASEIASNIV